MKKLGTVLALSAAGVAVAAACGVAAASAAPKPSPLRPTEIPVGASGNGTTVRAHPGEQVVVTLPSHTDGGFQWTLVNANGLELVSHTHLPGVPGRIGSSGPDIFTFTVEKPVRDHLKLVDERGWKGGGTLGSFELTVTTS